MYHRTEKLRCFFHQTLVGDKRRNAPMDFENKIINSRTLIGEYSRANKIRINESALVAQLMDSDSDGGVMIDVGAHVGSALPAFLEKGFKIFAFEPDEINREILEKRFGNQPNVIIDKRAISDKPAEKVQFYTSDESTGISSLTSFHKTHEKNGTVSVTTLEKFCEESKIRHINFLLVDAEGYDLFVLKGLDWSKITPDIVVCEFEDRKTISLGYNFHDMATFLQDRGYVVLVSEWHPIVRYGIAHDWRRLAKYPCLVDNPNAWGNLIALKEFNELPKLLSLVDRQTQILSRKSSMHFRVLKAIWRKSVGRLSKR
jgi:FkbM family methyltransferase